MQILQTDKNPPKNPLKNPSKNPMGFGMKGTSDIKLLPEHEQIEYRNQMATFLKDSLFD